MAAIYLKNLDPDTIVLAGEPILFASFYMLIYTLLDLILVRMKKRRKIT
jgi:hypothetical protein